MKTLDVHPRLIFVISFVFAAIPLTAILIFGTRVAWLLAAVPWGGSLLFLAITTWLESETRARRRHNRRGRTRMRSTGAS